MMTKIVPENRKNPLLFESDGDFNPGWFLFIEFAQLGAACVVVSIVAAIRSPEAWPAIVASLSFVGFAMLATAVIVVPLARAKLLAPALKQPSSKGAQLTEPTSSEVWEMSNED